MITKSDLEIYQNYLHYFLSSDIKTPPQKKYKYKLYNSDQLAKMYNDVGSSFHFIDVPSDETDKHLFFIFLNRNFPNRNKIEEMSTKALNDIIKLYDWKQELEKDLAFLISNFSQIETNFFDVYSKEKINWFTLFFLIRYFKSPLSSSDKVYYDHIIKLFKCVKPIFDGEESYVLEKLKHFSEQTSIFSLNQI